MWSGIRCERSRSSISTPMTGWSPASRAAVGEPDDPVQAVVVGDGQAAQAEGEGSLDELVDGRGAVEEREVGVAMELGVGHGQ